MTTVEINQTQPTSNTSTVDYDGYYPNPRYPDIFAVWSTNTCTTGNK